MSVNYYYNLSLGIRFLI